MDLKTLKDTPPWEWPEGAGKMFLEILRDGQADQSDRLLATELAGDFTVISDELVDALLSILRTFSSVFLPLAVGGVIALVFRPYYKWLNEEVRLPAPIALAIVFLSILLPVAAFPGSSAP